MPRYLAAAVAYFAIVFAVGFGLGALRVLVTESAMGRTLATLVELPVILAVSWIVCAWVVARFGVAAVTRDRLAMGAIAFAILMLAETLLGLGSGRSLGAQMRDYGEPGPALGLIAQIAFALFPWAQMRLRAPPQ